MRIPGQVFMSCKSFIPAKAFAAAFTLLLSVPVMADEFDGSKPLICATVEARDCVLQSECHSGEAREIGAPAFFRLNLKEKQIYGPERSVPIDSIEESPASVLIQGSEIGYGLSIGIDKQSGVFSASMTNYEGSFLLFGNCTTE